MWYYLGPQSVTEPLLNPQITVRSNVSNPVQVILNGQTLDYSVDQPSGNQEADAWGYAGELKLINGTNTLRTKVTFADGHVEEASSTTTDAKGQFNFNDIPAGRIDLFVDGRTVNPNLDSGKPQYARVRHQTT